MRWVQRGAFLLLAAVMALGAARLPTSPQRDAANEVYVYNGYAAATDAPWDEKSLELAAHRFQHLIDTYFTDGGYHFYLSVVPDKAQFTQPPEGYTPADAAETADWLAARLPVQTVDIASLLALEEYYRTDLHWRQERLLPVAQGLAEALSVTLPEDREETLCALSGVFHGNYWGKTAETLAADTLSYLTDSVLEGCTVYDYETDTLVVFRDSFGSSLIPLLAEGYGTVYAVDIRYLASDLLGRFVDFPDGADVLFLYSAAVLHNSVTLK